MLLAARKTLSEIMRMPVRPGAPFGLSGAMTELENPLRNAALLGLLKYVVATEDDRENPGRKIGDALEDLGENLFRKMKNLTKAFKI